MVAAGRSLRLSHPTLSAQVQALEASLGEPLFDRLGKRLVLNETGRLVRRYADEIFGLGRELLDAVQGRGDDHPLRLDVGVVDVVPKLVVRRLLMPALSLPQPVRLRCRESDYERLLAELAVHGVDLVVADAPIPAGSHVKAFSHLLGETGLTWFATPDLARSFREGFPRSLDGAPALLPLENVGLRRAMDAWFGRIGVRPRVVAEFEDSALLKVFGAEGVGVFPAPTVMEDVVLRQYGVEVLGRVPELRERFFVISTERKLRHPAVVAITRAARNELFAGPVEDGSPDG